MRINTNVSALDAYANLSRVQDAVSSSMAKLSSGFRITKASDDAAGLGIANKLEADGMAITQASRNAEQANSILQVAEGAADQIQKIVERMKELGTQAASDNTDDNGRARIKAEYDQLTAEITAITSTTKFQSKTLVDGNFGASVNTDTSTSTVLAAGDGVGGATIAGAAAGTYAITDVTGAANQLKMTLGTASQTITLTADGKQNVTFDKFGVTLQLDVNFARSADGVASSTAGDLVVDAGSNGGSFLVSSSGSYTTNDLVTLSNINLTTGSSGLNIDALTFTGNGTTAQWQAALTGFDTALDKVNTALGTIGASQNRITYALDNAKSTVENLAAAQSTIKDVDMASEMTTFSKNQILSQAGTAMLAQANQIGAGVLKLLQ